MFNEILEGGLNQAITRRLGMKGGAAAPAVAPEIFPTLCLEDDRPEWGYLKGEKLMSRQVTVAGVVGQYSMAQLYLPSTSSLIAVVTSIKIHAASTLVVARAQGIAAGLAGWAAIPTCVRDFRWPPNGSATLLESNQNAVLPSINFAAANMSSVNPVFDEPIVIAPASSLVVYSATLNTAINFTICWRERPALPGELD